MSENGFIISATLAFAVVMTVTILAGIERKIGIPSRRALIILVAVAFPVSSGVGYVLARVVFDAYVATSAFYQRQDQEMENAAAPR